MQLSQKDRQILRSLAEEQMEHARSPRNETLKKEWLLHNTFRGERPMIHIEIDTFQDEIITPLLQCTDEEARQLERQLYKNFLNQKLFHDDFVVNDYFSVGHSVTFRLFDLEEQVEHAAEGVGHHFVPVINDLEADFEKFRPSVITWDPDKTEKTVQTLGELFGDILPVKVSGGCLSAVPTQKLVHWMGMENMYYFMYDYPERFKELMDKMADEYLAYFHFLEKNNLLPSTTEGQRLNQGSFCFTNELPQEPKTTKDVWGYLDSQESVGVSAEMFREFIFPCYKKIAACFGLLSYGCCEPVDPVWESCISTLGNLRKVSISPWCNEDYMGEQLRGKQIVYLRKPSPNFLGVGSQLDEDAVTAHIDKTLQAAQGCTSEIAQRDVYTVNRDPEKVRRYVALIRQRCEKLYKK